MRILRPFLPVMVLAAVLMAFVGVSAAVEGDDPPETEVTTTVPVAGCDEVTPPSDAPASEAVTDETCEDADETTDTTEGTETTDTTDGSETTDTTGGTETTEAPENHGAAVSGAAHSCPAGPGHGACVSEVARSDAGKPDPGTTDDDEDLDDGEAHGKSAGRGNGRR